MQNEHYSCAQLMLYAVTWTRKCQRFRSLLKLPTALRPRPERGATPCSSLDFIFGTTCFWQRLKNKVSRSDNFGKKCPSLAAVRMIRSKMFPALDTQRRAANNSKAASYLHEENVRRSESLSNGLVGRTSCKSDSLS